MLEKKITNYEQLLEYTIPGKNRTIKEIVKNIINIFLIISFFIMCSAFSTYCYENYGINKWLGGVIISVISYLIIVKDVKAIIKTNEILMPVIILFIIIMAFLTINRTTNNVEMQMRI